MSGQWAWGQLPYAWLGVGALVVLWVNTGLVVLAACRPIAQLLDYRRRFLGGAAGVIVEGEPLAHHVIAQIGRCASDDSDRRAIIFHDSDHHGRLTGGVIEVGDAQRLEIDGLPNEDIEVWIDEARRAAVVANLEEADFDEAYRAAAKARGYRREVCASVGVGCMIWFADLDRAGRALLANFDPVAWCLRRMVWGMLGVLAMIGVLLGVTGLLLQPPIFGPMSTLGGVFGLLYFLLVQPAGVMIRDALAPPSRSKLRGSWVQLGSEGLGATGGQAAAEPSE
jgi:hypothetical protein